MVNEETGNARFEMQQLPQEVSRKVSTMEPGDVSEPFIMKDPRKNSDIIAMVKLTARIPGHKANIADDFQTIKSMYESAQKTKILKDWLDKKIASTYIRIEDGWRDCDFEHKGWLKNTQQSTTY